MVFEGVVGLWAEMVFAIALGIVTAFKDVAFGTEVVFQGAEEGVSAIAAAFFS